MKTGTTFAILAALCCVAWAASDAINNRQLAVADGPDAVTIPRMLSYQGKLTDTTGVPVPNGNYQLTFRLYATPSGGSAFWIEAQTIMVINGLFSAHLGALTPITSVPDPGELYLGLQVAASPELSPRLRIVSSAYSYLAERAANSDLLQGKDTIAFDSRYVNEAQANSVTSAMITNGTIAAADLNQMGASTGQVMKWTGSAWAPRNDSVGGGGGGTVTSVSQATGVVCTPNPITATGTVGFDQTWGDARYVNEAQANSVTSAMITNGAVAAADLNQMGASTGQVMKWTGSTWAAWNDSVGSGDNAWVRAGSDSVLYTIRRLGIARGGSGNRLWGDSASSHVNLGVVCTTGTSGQSHRYATVGGGYRNIAGSGSATVGGGWANFARGAYATVAGGEANRADSVLATVGGGSSNQATGLAATVGGGDANTASARAACVAGGMFNSAEAEGAAVGGGTGNHATAGGATVPGGFGNLARGFYSFAAGTRARAHHDYSFVWSDDPVDSCYTTGANQFRVRARGGTWFFSNNQMTTGAYLAAGSNSWASACDSATKEDFREVNRQELLDKVAALRVRNYKMRDQDDGTRHIGPVAQDFAAAFGVGENEKSINMADADGVLLAAIQALYEDSRQLRQELEALKAALAQQKR